MFYEYTAATTVCYFVFSLCRMINSNSLVWYLDIIVSQVITFIFAAITAGYSILGFLFRLLHTLLKFAEASKRFI